MTEKNLEQALLQHTDLLHRISVSLLRNRQDREDAVQSAIEKALRRRGRLRDAAALGEMSIAIVCSLLKATRRSTGHQQN